MSEQTKTAIVTGGARGIGRAIAHCLGGLGFNLVLSYRADDAAAQEASAALRATGADPLLVRGDTRRRGDVERLFDAAAERFGAIDVVCANAGVENVDTAFADLDEAELDRVVDTNVKGTFFTLQQAARRVADGGRVIATGSTIARYPHANAGAYAGTKAAVRVMVEVLAQELGPRQVTVNTLEPGIVAGAGVVADLSDEMRAAVVRRTPLGRMLVPSDLEGLVAFLASEGAAMITGQHLAVTGGARP